MSSVPPTAIDDEDPLVTAASPEPGLTEGVADAAPAARSRTYIRLLLPGLAIIAALIAGLVLGQRATTPAGAVDAVDLGFARDMQAHHAQAVDMSSIVYRRTGDPAIVTLAFDILTTQQGQIGIMTGWLDLWRPNVDTEPERPMAWMGQPHDGTMPGMASRPQVEALRTVPVTTMNEQFLRLMIDHHRGALPMAAYAAKHANSPEVKRFAANVETGQAVEIDLMQSMLRERGWAPQPEPMPSTHGDHG
jgi:uncharacterized protein (DUF305 family)